MSSLYDDVSARLQKDPGRTKRGVARFDLSLLLFNARDSLCELWQAADRCLQSRDGKALDDLRAAVEQLRPIFGDRREGE